MSDEDSAAAPRTLVDAQTRLAAAELRRLSLGGVRERFQIVTQATIMLGVLAAMVAVVATVIVARRDHSVVVEPFLVPPSLAARGLSGEVVAGRFLDRLVDMQARTESARPAASYTNDWGKQIRVEIPTTGVSLEDVRRTIYESFSRRTRIGGDVVLSDATMQVTARAGGKPGTMLNGPTTTIDTLLSGAAEDVYRQLQPYRYVTYLRDVGRADAFETRVRQLAMEGDEVDRPWAFSLWAVGDIFRGRFADGLRRARRAVELQPDLVAGHVNVAATLALLGRDGEAHEVEERVLELLATPSGKRSVTAEAAESITARFEAQAAAARGDWLEPERAYLRLAEGPRYNNALLRATRARIVARISAHDIPGAVRLWRESDELNDLEGLGPTLDYNWPRLAILEATGRWAEALALLEAADQKLAAGFVYREGFVMRAEATRTVFILPHKALALANTGRLDDALVLVEATPMDCYLCLRVRGQLASRAQDWAKSDAAFTAAVRLAPELAMAQSEWALAQLARGNAAGALATIGQAKRLAPNWADLHKSEGDALVRLGRKTEAVRAYDKALRLAPAWSEAVTARAQIKKQT